MPVAKQTTVGKRQGIADSNKVMFIWVAGASVIVGFALVFSWFLYQQIAFKTTVVNAKNETVSILKDNNKAAEVLRDDIGLLKTNAALGSMKESPGDNPVQFILDALPADANELALGASLQKKLIGPVEGVTLESLVVEPTGLGALDAGSSVDPEIRFKFEVRSNDPNRLKALLSRFEKSIRVFDIDSLSIERSDSNYTMGVNAHAYYEPPRVIELKEEEL